MRTDPKEARYAGKVKKVRSVAVASLATAGFPRYLTTKSFSAVVRGVAFAGRLFLFWTTQIGRKRPSNYHF
jgi:hypothetical protein